MKSDARCPADELDAVVAYMLSLKKVTAPISSRAGVSWRSGAGVRSARNSARNTRSSAASGC